MTITLNKYDAYIFRRYITDLEFQSVQYEISKQKLVLLEEKNVLWEQTAANYKNQLSIADLTLTNQIVLQEEEEDYFRLEIEKVKKNSLKKGFKKGAIVATAATLILCLLIK